jgi:RNA ligase
MKTITSQQELQNAVANLPEIRWQLHDNGVTVAAYMIAGDETFQTSYGRECRGIAFYDNKVVGRPLHKFFNVGEKPYLQMGVVDWSKVVRIMNKRDGSMINTVAVPSEKHGTSFSVKSKKTFSSVMAEAAMEWIKEDKHTLDLCERCVDHGLTAIFEWTAPDNRIVINYETADLQLLHIRDNITGRYFSQAELEEFASSVRIVDNISVDRLQSILASAETVEGVEGWVFQFSDGDMVKLKTKWYLDRHYAMTALRHRDVAEMVLNESIDDIKSKLAMSGIDIQPVLSIEKRVLYIIRSIEEDVTQLYTEAKDMSRKDAAIKFKTHPYFSLLMQCLSDKNPETKKYVIKYLLQSEFSLQLVY